MQAAAQSRSATNADRHADRTPALDPTTIARLERQVELFARNNGLSKEVADSLVSAHFLKYVPKQAFSSAA